MCASIFQFFQIHSLVRIRELKSFSANMPYLVRVCLRHHHGGMRVVHSMSGFGNNLLSRGERFDVEFILVISATRFEGGVIDTVWCHSEKGQLLVISRQTF